MTTDAGDYSMRISRLTVDKLGVKLYDRASAVIAELIANAYDADARQVTVSVPAGRYLATKAGGQIRDKGLTIEIKDNGIGMTPVEVQEFFLVIGAERRSDALRGAESRRFKRRVMGRKGVGKLAPFGICKIIEVVSAGGKRIKRNGGEGHLTSHIILNYDDIVAIGDEPDERYRPGVGRLDNTLSPTTGTTITLRNFNYRRVSEVDVLARQIAQRFGIQSDDWEIRILDNTQTNAAPHIVGSFDVKTMPNTRLYFQPDRTVIGPDGNPLSNIQAGFQHESIFRPVTGWMAYSKEPYKDDLMAGVRIYCRGKIAAQTSLFNRKAGFTGEHSIRSYLVGELHADWLDEDDDLIQTDRRDILWSDELAAAFQEWGQDMVRRIGKLSRDPMRKATLDVFMETGRVEERIRAQFPSNDQEGIRERASNLAKMFGQRISRAEAEDVEAVNHLVDLSVEFAPHITLDDMMHKAAEEADTPMAMFRSFLRTARIAELSSFGRIADDRLKVIHRLEELKDQSDTQEDSLQRLIDDAPWLVDPEWAPVTANRTLHSLRKEFEKYYEQQTGKAISLSDFENPKKRPDFVLSSQDGVAQIVEIKKPDHKLTNAEMERIHTYYECMKSFLKSNPEFRKKGVRDFHITLVCDNLALTGMPDTMLGFMSNEGKLTRLTWREFLLRTETVHKAFLDEAERQKTIATEAAE